VARTVGEQLEVALDVVAGMAFLHQFNTLHQDLKSANVLLDERGRAKVYFSL